MAWLCCVRIKKVLKNNPNPDQLVKEVVQPLVDEFQHRKMSQILSEHTTIEELLAFLTSTAKSMDGDSLEGNEAYKIINKLRINYSAHLKSATRYFTKLQEVKARYINGGDEVTQFERFELI